jgi:predicted ester cyclase
MLIHRFANVFLLSLAIAASSASAQSTAEQSAAARALVARYVQLKNSRDATHLGELYRENYIENTGRNPSGLPALTENWKAQFAAIPDLQVTVNDVIVEGNKVVARLTYAGTHATPFFAGIPPTGRKFSFGTIDIWRLEEGKFAEHWDQVDFAGLQRHLTAKPATP